MKQIFTNKRFKDKTFKADIIKKIARKNKREERIENLVAFFQLCREELGTKVRGISDIVNNIKKTSMKSELKAVSTSVTTWLDEYFQYDGYNGLEEEKTFKDEILKEKARKEKRKKRKDNFSTFIKLNREKSGTKVKGLSAILKKHKKISVGTGLVTIVTSLSILLSGCSNAENKDFEEEVTTSIEAETTPEITTVELTTTTPIETTTEVETTQVEVSVTETTAEIIVTPAETTTPIETTTEAQTTIAPVTTTAAPQPVVEPAKPIQIEDLNGKVALFKGSCLKNAGLTVPNEEMIRNAIRVMHSDFIQHDGLNEITVQKYNRSYLSLLTSYGSVNNVNLGALYIGAVDKVENGVYIPIEICPKENQRLISEFTQLSENYRLALNSIGSVGMLEMTSIEEEQVRTSVNQELEKLDITDMNERKSKYIELYSIKWQEMYQAKYNEMFNQGLIGSLGMIEITPLEENQIQNLVMQELDNTNIENPNEWENKFGQIYTSIWTDMYEVKQSITTDTRNTLAKAEYRKFYNGVIDLVNSKDYEKLTQPEKLIIFTNISGALVSGMTEKQKNEYMVFHRGIESSIDDTIATLVAAKRNNINQKDALDKIIENNQASVNGEREDLKALAKILEDMYESGKLHVYAY